MERDLCKREWSNYIALDGNEESKAIHVTVVKWVDVAAVVVQVKVPRCRVGSSLDVGPVRRHEYI